MNDIDLQRRIDELERQLHESQQTVHALASGEIDSIVHEAGSTPVLLLAAQSELQANELLFRAVFDGAMDAMLIADDDGRYIDANPAACLLFGLAKADLLGRRIAEFSPPEYPSAKHWETFIHDGSSRGEFPLMRADGERRELEFSAVAGVLPGVNLSILRDVTQRNASENALRQSEQRLRTVIANAPLILFTLDRDGIFTFHGGKAVEAVGLRPGELVGQSVFARQKDRFGAESEIRRALAGEQVDGEFEFGGKSFDCTLVPKRGDDGEILGVIGVAMDVSSRKAAEVALRASEARFRAMIENDSDGIWLIGRDGVIKYASPSSQRIIGFSPAELVGTPIRDRIHPDDLTYIARETVALIGDPSLARVLEFRALHRDGSVRWIEAMRSNLLDDPAVGAIVSNFRDVTTQKLAEAELREAELRFRRLYEAGIIGVTVGDRACLVSEANDTFLELVGYSRSDVRGGRLNTLEITPTELLPAQVGITVSLDVTGKAGPWEKEYFRRDGTRVPVLVGAATLDEDRIITVVVDLTKQKRADERRAGVVNAALDAVVIMDAHGRITEMNPAAERMFRFVSSEVVGFALAEKLLPLRFRDDHLEGLERYLKAGDGDVVGKRIELAAVRRDGTEFPVELSISRVGSGRRGASWGSSAICRSSVARRTRCARRKNSFAKRRRWKPSGASPAASRTTSTICSR
jgi:PAS domain S-box-containing protein